MAIGAVHDDGVGARDVESVLDDAGRDQHIELTVHKGQHHAFQLSLRHLPVAHGDARLRNQFAYLRRQLVDRLHAIVDEVGLPAALQIHLDSGTNELLVILRDDRLDRHAIFRRGLDDAHVAHLLEPFLVADAEALLLVDDEQAEVLELQPLREQRVRSDQDVHLALLGAL